MMLSAFIPCEIIRLDYYISMQLLWFVLRAIHFKAVGTFFAELQY